MPPKEKFNFNASRVFLTYPQCPLSKETLLEFIKTIKEPTTYVIGQESHKDGTPHLHAFFSFDSKIHTTSTRFFDHQGYHPNIKKVPSAEARKNFIKYVKKDGNFITNELEVLGKREELFSNLLTQGLTPEFVRKNPSLLQFNLSNLKSWINYVCPYRMEMKNLPKKRHIWLHGPRNTGKTTFARIYLTLFDSGILPYNDDFGLVPYNCDLLFGDEFKGQLSVQQLNRLCDGGCHCNTKGGSIILGQPLLFICSNYSIDECYSGTSDDIRLTVHARFNQYLAPLYPVFPTCEL